MFRFRVIFLFLLLFTGAVFAGEQEDAFTFLKQNMPAGDRGKVTDEQLRENVDLALKARQQNEWAKSIPWSLFQNDVLPYAVIDEPRDEWRADFYNRFTNLTGKASTLKEAIFLISSKIEKELDVSYNIGRKRPNQSPMESIDQGKASCTGLSILLVNAYRSVGIPARMCGVLSWTHIRGNHSWVEVWDGESWRMIEYGSKEFDTPWVLEYCHLLDTSRWEHKVWSTSWSRMDREETRFPLIWNARPVRDRWQLVSNSLDTYAVDVSSHYKEMARKFATQESAQNNKDTQILFVSVRDGKNDERLPAQVTLNDKKNNRQIFKGVSKAGESDIRDYLQIGLPRQGSYQIKCDYQGKIKKEDLKATEENVRVLEYKL